ncbi:hypothetical protein [Bradyrhizobium sp. SZCCHNPS1003]|uniref:hypothetical protein n=1 Tax=Bradyrhizobium sp. SZCCHNPS1003 TaxID=3057330 RepID=UPI0028E610C0|nr:hypothetical protein [Bradyrhizobium sp. SZCCHNPS1003]
MTQTQLQHYERARRRLADADIAFMEMVAHPTNPMTREDLHALIKLRPDHYGRFAGWLDVLPSRAS